MTMTVRIATLLLLCSGCAGWRVTHCNYDQAYRAGVAAGQRHKPMGAFPSMCEPPERPTVERGYREGYLAGWGCGAPPAPSQASFDPDTKCTFDYAYRAGINAAVQNRPMSHFAERCDPTVSAEVQRGYSEGYGTAVSCRPPPPVQVAAPAPAAVQTYSAPQWLPPPSGGPPPQWGAAPQQPGGSGFSCCVNHRRYTCPDAAAVDRCGGAYARCLMSCNGMGCGERCQAQAPPDPSGCTPDGGC